MSHVRCLGVGVVHACVTGVSRASVTGVWRKGRCRACVLLVRYLRWGLPRHSFFAVRQSDVPLTSKALTARWTEVRMDSRLPRLDGWGRGGCDLGRLLGTRTMSRVLGAK